jgi:hypothetical protein
LVTVYQAVELSSFLAVDYLSEGALTESMSYVFGPVLKLLRSVGYEDGANLGAAPYDWRIPVSCFNVPIPFSTTYLTFNTSHSIAKCT